ncbi:SLATT domain-containing protein [Streptomyces sp. XY511]|uniref:SLATT domain-containing protein n=1 Tax=Streptomyces sp. XY511 TaxID=1519480 RepID=UPI000A9B6AD7|nr:SLATT domain-containing protein [Streptomyces sp. XY511]
MQNSTTSHPGGNTTDELIQYRRDVTDYRRRIRNRRLQVLGLYVTPVLLILSIFSCVAAKNVFWLGKNMPGAVEFAFFLTFVFLAASTALQFAVEFSKAFWKWEDKGTSVAKLRLDLELAEERRILEARRLTPSAVERQASYKERTPVEVERLRKESRYYRRVHFWMQWMLFFCSAGVTAVTAWYDPPQPGKGVLIALGFTITVITGAAGYFKPRERAFNLQQTADSIEQHVTALDLGIAPYVQGEALNLELFATTVESMRIEQRKREQQLDQPHQGQQEVI